MRTNYLTTYTMAALVGLAMHTSVVAADEDSGGVKFRFPVGATFANGAYDLNDKLEDSFRANGYTITDDFVWPVGLSFNPRVEFPFGLGLGVTLGPTEFLAVETNDNNNSDDTDFNLIVPVGGYVQYNFLRDKTVSPYVRAGVRYPITGGDYIKSGSVGAFVAAGVEFYRTEKVGFGVEVGYDWSEVKVSAGPVGGDQTVRPIGFNVSIFALF
jgi:hypothetical protein